MTEKHFCRCCLSEECYKDMANEYYIGNKTENYTEMLLNIFNIKISNAAERCLICEDCVTKLRDAAAFKKQVLSIQETIQNRVCWYNNDIETNKSPDIEDDEYNDDNFDDDISTGFDSGDFEFDYDCNQDSSQKGQYFVINLESKENIPLNETVSRSKLIKSKSRNKNDSNKNTSMKNSSTVATKTSKMANNTSIFDSYGEESDYTDDIYYDTDFMNSSSDLEGSQKMALSKNIMRTKGCTGTQEKKSINALRVKSQDTTKTELHSKDKRENTLKLVQNSNLCLFRSFQNKFGCNFCQTKFPVFSQLREHSVTHSNPKTIALNLNRLRGLTYKNAEITDLKCNLCSEMCANLNILMDHLKSEHEISFRGTEHYLVPYQLQNGFRCVSCDSKFNSYLRLSIHMNSHYTNNVCEMCGLSFINRLGLRAHVQAQHKEKKCSLCPAIFLTNSAKVKHLRQIHSIQNSKRYCNLCSKTFRYTYMLEEHKIQEHGVKRQISMCQECGKTFLTASNLKIHVRSVHIRERNFPCARCGMRFFTKCDRNRHERTHEDVRSFSCSYCEAKFKSKDSWRRHLKRQHGHVFGEAS